MRYFAQEIELAPVAPRARRLNVFGVLVWFVAIFIVASAGLALLS